MQAKGRQDRIIEQVIALARDAAPDLTAVLITHYPDVETLDTFRPGETDLGTVAAVNRAVAIELAAAGVRVFVQVADRAAFRRWLTGRPDTQESRWAWRPQPPAARRRRPEGARRRPSPGAFPPEARRRARPAGGPPFGCLRGRGQRRIR